MFTAMYSNAKAPLRLAMCGLAVQVLVLLAAPGLRAQSEGELSFPITRIEVSGNTLYPEEILQHLLAPFTGGERGAEDVEAARRHLEKFYQDNGYLRVLVNIPQQEVTSGVVRLEVLESRVGEVKVVGNRYFSQASILRAVPALRPGTILHVPEVEKQLNALNADKNLAVRLKLLPARDLGVDDVELQVEDTLPLHASLELNNRASHNTSSLRLNGVLRYENLWQRKHSLSLQYQTTPKEPDEVQVVGLSYVMPAFWNPKHYLASYAVWTDSETAFGEGFSVLGNGFIAGARYLVPLPPRDTYYHTLSLGLDYKDFNETIGVAGDEASRAHLPITYLPFSLDYQGTHVGKTGNTQVHAGVSGVFRGLVSDPEEFAEKRLDARGNYLIFTAGIEREQRLPWNMGLGLKVDGQLASEPLISSEQYSAGGMQSVRGYKESDSLGDNAVHFSGEWRLPELGSATGQGSWLKATPYAFYDFAWLTVKSPGAEATDEFAPQGTGVGLRGTLFGSIDYQADMARALKSTDRTDGGATRLHFLVKYRF